MLTKEIVASKNFCLMSYIIKTKFRGILYIFYVLLDVIEVNLFLAKMELNFSQFNFDQISDFDTSF